MEAETPRYCADAVRRHDPDRFLTAQFAADDRRGDLLALYAFNLEIARTRELVSERLIGQIRLQWWREAIAGIYDGPARAHPVVGALAAAVARHRLSRSHFERLIDGREADLAEAGPATLDALVDYAEATSASLVCLALEALGCRDEPTMAAGRAAGIGFALTGLIRAVPYQLRTRRLSLPQDLMAEAGVDPTALLDRGHAPGLDRVARRIAERARDHLADARRLGRAAPRAALPALLPATLAAIYLRELGRVGFDPFRLPPHGPRLARPVRLALAALTGRI